MTTKEHYVCKYAKYRYRNANCTYYLVDVSRDADGFTARVWRIDDDEKHKLNDNFVGHGGLFDFASMGMFVQLKQLPNKFRDTK
jgi:hypothetical protein